MAPALTELRVRQDVELVSRAGLALEDFLAETVASVSRAVPWVAACVGTHDPDTHLLTSARKYGHLRTVDSHDHEFGLIEYGTVEQTSFLTLALGERPVAGVHDSTGGDVGRSVRMATFMRPLFDFADEARLVFREGAHSWGAMALFRGPEDGPFDPLELEFLTSLSGLFARGVRAGLLSTLVAPGHLGDPGDDDPLGPAVIIVGADDRIMSVSDGMQGWIERLMLTDGSCDPLSPVSALVGAARRYARGEADQPPRSRVRTADGTWLVLHAGPLSGAGADRVGEVVVTVERARPPEIISLLVGAFDLTPREDEVTRLVLAGRDTKQIGAALHLSPYTVQDHLKSVFEKAGVRSRRELISKIFVEQYRPRLGSSLGPAGCFR